MSHHVLYPVEGFPLDCIVDATRIMRERRVAEERVLLVKHLWTIETFALKLVFGEPDAVHGADSQPFDSMWNDDLQNFEDACQFTQGYMAGETFGDEGNSLDPATILAIISAIVKILSLFKKR